ncbi:MAG: FG-GAP-like repeat-containing protein [Isosphaeraceae bacterium]
MHRRWKRVVGSVVALVVASVAVTAARSWTYRNAFLRALAEADAGNNEAAAGHLAPLVDRPPMWDPVEPGRAPFLLGVCRWRLGRRDEALEAFARVPGSSPFGPDAAAYLAEGDLDRGRWRAAEDRLERAFRASAKPSTTLLAALERVYRMQARIGDAARMIRAKIEDDPPAGLAALRDLWRTERGTPDVEAIARAQEIGSKLAPDDERVWLGRARLAIESGRLSEAETWLKRCETKNPDAPVWRAVLDWARVAGRPDQAARALRSLETVNEPDALTDLERLTWRAWFAERAGDAAAEARALEGLITLAPRDTRWLARLAAVEPKAAAKMRERKAEVDRALDEYTQLMARPNPPQSVPELLDSARLADAAGRPFDARVWRLAVLRLNPADAEARTRLAQQDEQGPPRLLARLDPKDDPWSQRPAESFAASAAATPGQRTARFRDVASTSGLIHTFRNGETAIRQMPVALSGGVALIDHDGDGDLDVYCLQGGPFPPESSSGGDRLFRNRGDGTYEDVTAASGVGAVKTGYGHGAAVGDVDGDGHPDLFLTRWRSYVLLRNRGDGTFEDATERFGLDGDRDWPTSAAFADLDSDGDLDLYVCHYVEWDETHPRLCRNPSTNAFMSCDPKSSRARPDHLFRNDGGRFTDVSESSGVLAADRDGRGLGVVAADLDEDGKVDLFVANDKSANFFFHNLGGLKFEEVAHASGLAGNAEGGYQAGMGVACGDLDGDGRLDLAVTNYYGESTTFYHNEGGGLFTDRTAASGLGPASRLRLGFGAAMLDAQNDGRLDLVTANGHTDDLGDRPYRMPAQLLLGPGEGRLVDATDAAGPDFARPRRPRPGRGGRRQRRARRPVAAGPE